LLGPPPALGITAVEKTFAELVGQADLIVVGTIGESQSLQLPGGAIVTRHLVKVSRVVKGEHDPGLPLPVQVLGGQVGDLELNIAGAPTFLVGERVILFIRGNMREAFPFAGVRQGIFKLAWDVVADGERVLDWQRRPVVGFRDGRVVTDAHRPLTDALQLNEFLREIQWALGP